MTKLEPESEGRVSDVEMMWWCPVGPAGQIQKYLSFSNFYICLSKTKSKAEIFSKSLYFVIKSSAIIFQINVIS